MPRTSEGPGRQGHGERAAYRAEAALEADFADDQMVADGAIGKLLAGDEQANRNGQVETGAELSDVGGREIYRYALERKSVAGIGERGADPLPALADRALGKPDGRERWKAAADVYLDVDRVRVDAEDGRGTYSREHDPDLDDGARNVPCRHGDGAYLSRAPTVILSYDLPKPWIGAITRLPRNSGPFAAQLPHAPPPATRKELDTAVDALGTSAGHFATMALQDRIKLLRSMRAGYARIATRTVVASCRAKRIVLGTPLEGEEWSLGPWPVLRHFRLLLDSLYAIENGDPFPAGEVTATLEGRARVKMFPGNTLDSFVHSGIRADVHLHSGVDPSSLGRSRLLARGVYPRRIALVLEPGNVAAIPCMDVLTRMFNHGMVCLLKMHPLNSYLGPLYEEAFATAIEQDFLRIVYGGAEAGHYLCSHAGIDEIHLTGSALTREIIAKVAPDKPLSSQLGCVTPVLIVPGPYLDAQLEEQATRLAGTIVHNAGCNCTTPRVIVTPYGWAQRDAFLRHLEQALAEAPLRLAYYPGATERWEYLARRRTGIRFVGSTVGGMLPWTLVPDLDPDDREEQLFALEPFCPIVAETQVGSGDPIEFLTDAVNFVNQRLWGSLSAMIVIHPRSQDDPAIAEALEEAVERLKYGTVGVNVWPQFSFCLASTPWGGTRPSPPRTARAAPAGSITRRCWLG